MKNITAIVIMIAAISFLPQIASAQGATTCNSAALSTSSGFLGSFIFDMQTSSANYGLTVLTHDASGKFIIPFSFPKFDILYAELLLIQKSPPLTPLTYKIDYTIDASNILCSMTVKRNPSAAPVMPAEEAVPQVPISP